MEHSPELSRLLIHLLKGVLYQEAEPELWEQLLRLQTQVREVLALLNLELVLDLAEGYAFLKNRPEPEADDPSPRLPRLIARRPLAFLVSLLLALLRRKLAEFDASGGDTRLILDREAILELLRVFLPDTSNEARLFDQIDTVLNKVVELGFLRKLKPPPGSAAGPVQYEVQRILKAFVDAQWLAEFETRLVAYQARLAGADAGGADAG